MKFCSPETGNEESNNPKKQKTKDYDLVTRKQEKLIPDIYFLKVWLQVFWIWFLLFLILDSQSPIADFPILGSGYPYFLAILIKTIFFFFFSLFIFGSPVNYSWFLILSARFSICNSQFPITRLNFFRFFFLA